MNQSPRKVTGEEFYSYISTLGGYYGDAFKLLESAEILGTEAISIFRAPASGVGAESIFVDAMISTGHLFGMSPGMRASSVPLALPAGVSAIDTRDLSGERFRIRTLARGTEQGFELFDVDAYTLDGELVAKLEGVQFHRLVLPHNDDRNKWAGSRLHSLRWKAVPSRRGSMSRVVITAPNMEIGSTWKRAIEKTGCSEVELIVPDAVDGTLSHDASRIAGVSEQDTCHLLVSHEACDWTLANRDAPKAAVNLMLRWFESVAKATPTCRPVVVVSGANRVEAGERVTNPTAAAAWAAAGALGMGGRFPRFLALDVDRALSPEAAAAGLMDALAVDSQFVALRGESLHVPFLSKSSGDGAVLERRPRPLQDAAVLVTGASGALGQFVLEWAEEEGCRRVTAVSRGKAPAVPNRIVRAEERFVEGSVVDAELWDRVGADHDVLFHLAGENPDESDGATSETLDRAFGAKYEGLLNLCTRLDEQRPAHLVLFSSVSALLGSPGQLSYSAANAAAAAAAACLLEGTVHKLTVVHFGPWSGAGMAADAALSRILTAKGVEPIEPWVGLRALSLAMQGPDTGCVIAAFNTLYPLPVVQANAEAQGEGEGQGSAALDLLRGLGEEQRLSVVRNAIVKQAAISMEMAPERIDPDADLFEMGFDSLMALEIRNALGSEYEIKIGLGVLMGARTLNEVANATLPIIDMAVEEREAKRDVVQESSLVI